EIAMRSELVLRFDYGAAVPWVTRLADGAGVRAIAGPDMTVLRTSAPLRGERLRTLSEFTLRAGEQVAFVLSHGASHQPDPPPIDPVAALQETEAFWRRWAARCRHEGEWRDAVLRSHLTLKALTYAPTGGIVAAP